MKRPDVVTYCEHGAETWRKTRAGAPACPFCRRLAPRSPDKQPGRQKAWDQPVLDVAVLRSGDDSIPQVIDLATRRRNRNRNRRKA